MNKSLIYCISKLKKYLLWENANEISINQPKIINILCKEEWTTIKDNEIDSNLLNDLVIELARERNMDFNLKNPILSTEIPEPYNRYRVQALHRSIIANSDIAISIRIPNKRIFSLDDNFFINEDVSLTFKDLVTTIKKGDKNILISGATGSGKTSFLNALMAEINENERIITIENAQELNINNSNKVQMLINNSNNKFSYNDAINSSLRLNPDRILLGEIDISNTLAFLRINNSGHSGNISTIHANTPIEAINALINNICLFGLTIDKNILLNFIRSSIDMIIQIKFNKESKKREITDIINIKEYLSKEQIINEVEVRSVI